MKQAVDALHLLTPLSDQPPANIEAAHSGDLVADLRGFPAHAHRIDAHQGCLDITGTLTLATDYWAVAGDWLLALTERCNLQRDLAIEGYGFWWSLVRHHFAPSLSDLGNSFAWIDLLYELSQQYRPEKIIIYGDHAALSRFAQEIFTNTPDFQTRPNTAAPAKTWYQPSLNLPLIAVRTVIGLVYLLWATLRPYDIYIFSTTNLLRQIKVGSQQQLLDLYQADLGDRLQKKKRRVGRLETYGWGAAWRKLLSRGWFFPTDLIFLSGHPAFFKFGFYPNLRRKWRRLWQETEPGLEAHLSYRRCDLSPLVEPLLRQMFIETAPSLEVMTKLWRRLLRLWRPKLLYLVTHSYGRSLITAVIAARSLHIPTVEQQHGVIGKNHFAYLIPKQLRAQAKIPLCDRMVVWGEHTKRLLVAEGVYQPDQAAVCGFLRLDWLLRNQPPRPETLAKLSIPAEAAVALYTSNLVAESLMDEILQSIEAVPAQANLYWIVKLHPAEKRRRQWEAAIRRRQLPNVRIVGSEFDFYGLLAACDIHLSFASTTILEAAVFGKINLGLDIKSVPDPIGYAAAGGFLPVAPNCLGARVYGILNNPAQQEQLRREQQRFAQDWCLHDGQAAGRVVQFIEKTIRVRPRF